MNFNLFTAIGVSWYMFALAVFMVVTWLTRNRSPWYLLAFSLVIALASGYDNSITYSNALTQMLGFYPYYLLGYALSPEKVLSFLEHKWLKVLSLLFLIGLAWFCVQNPDLVHSYRPLLTFSAPYSKLSIENAGFLNRALVYAVQCAASIAVMSVIPKQKLPLVTTWGGRTIQVYLFHRSIIFGLVFCGLGDWLRTELGRPMWLILWLLCSICLACILSTKPVKKLYLILAGE